MDHLLKDIEAFCANDEETVRQFIDNEHSYDFISENFPVLSCPDRIIEETFAFRCWTLRKHLKQTPDGFVVSEFLPPVRWAGKHNTINAALFHHLNELRWLKNPVYGTEYLSFFLDEKGASYRYYTPALTEMASFYHVTGQDGKNLERLPDFERYLSVFEERHRLPNGLFWSEDNLDAMEFSISGRNGHEQLRGIRPTLNSYLYGGFRTLQRLYHLSGNAQKEEAYRKKAETLKKAFRAACFDGDFFKAVHLPEPLLSSETVSVRDLPDSRNVREEIGYLPFLYGLNEDGDEACFRYLFDETVFATPYGITTADRSSKRFLYEADHECLWNGYIWPFATSQTISAMIAQRNRTGEKGSVTNQNIYSLIHTYAGMHWLTENGRRVNWIDEVMSPLNGEWYSRNWLKSRGWPQEKGGYERGKDYNHSTFLDLVIRGLIGVDETSDTLSIRPGVVGIWEWFSLENFTFRGKTYDIYYDQDGSHFPGKKGLVICKK